MTLRLLRVGIASVSRLLLGCCIALPLQAQDSQPTSSTPGASDQQQVTKKNSIDLYGFVMLDSGYDFGQNDPDWFDVTRPTKLPSFKDQFGANGNVYFGVRQTR